MKKTVKRFAAILLMLAVLLSLTGCAYLDELRQQQGFLIDGNVHWNGAVYKPLPESDSFAPAWGHQTVCVTEPDVPVLLSDTFFSQYMAATEDGLFLAGDVYYCREDVYDEWSARMSEVFNPQVLCYSYYEWNEETQEGGDTFYVLTKEQEKAIKTVLETEDPMTITDGWSLDYSFYISLEAATEDLIFRTSAGIDIAQAGVQFYVMESKYGKTSTYTVPQEYSAVFGEIMAKYYEFW